MINRTSYDLATDDGPLHITITPINERIPGGDFYATGIFRLTNGVVGLGDISFDNDMQDWEYDAIGELSYQEAAKVAEFIRNYKDPVGADPTELNFR